MSLRPAERSHTPKIASDSQQRPNGEIAIDGTVQRRIVWCQHVFCHNSPWSHVKYGCPQRSIGPRPFEGHQLGLFRRERAVGRLVERGQEVRALSLPHARELLAL